MLFLPLPHRVTQALPPCSVSRYHLGVIQCPALMLFLTLPHRGGTGPSLHALFPITTQGWPTHQNAFLASPAPLVTNQVRSSAKCVPETPILRREPKNASGVMRTPNFQVRWVSSVYSLIFSAKVMFVDSVLVVSQKSHTMWWKRWARNQSPEMNSYLVDKIGLLITSYCRSFLFVCNVFCSTTPM